MYLDFLDIKIKYVIANMYEVIGARFETLDWKLYTLIAAHYCAAFSVRLPIALNMLSWVWCRLRREYANDNSHFIFVSSSVIW